MSIVLDVVQQIVLHSAYELTFAAAVQVFNKYKKLDEKSCQDCVDEDMLDIQTSEPNIAVMHNIKVTEPPAQPVPTNVELKPSNRQLAPVSATSQLDIPCKHSGPICPPKTSTMRLCRDSYFS